MLKGHLFSRSKTQNPFFSSRGSVFIWLISAICFAVVFFAIIFLLLWGRTSDRKPPIVPAALNREVREPIKSFTVSKQGAEKSEKPDPSVQKPLSADPSRIQDVSPDDPLGKGMLSQDLTEHAPPVLSENHKTPKVPTSPPLVAENSKLTDNTLPPDVEKPTPASIPQVSLPTEKSVRKKTESVEKESKEMTVMVAVGNIRKGPSVKQEVVFTVSRGDTLQVTDQKGNWYAVRLDNGQSGWAHRSLLHGPSVRPTKTATSSPKNRKKSVINGIRTVVTDPNHAQIIFELSGYHPPEIMVIEGEVPRVVCDFFSARLAPGVKKNISVTTGVVKRIRVGVHKGSNPKVRVVLDLNAGQNYAVEQFFFEKENYYALMVNSGK